jgi:hypothetical protein
MGPNQVSRPALAQEYCWQTTPWAICELEVTSCKWVALLHQRWRLSAVLPCVWCRAAGPSPPLPLAGILLGQDVPGSTGLHYLLLRIFSIRPLKGRHGRLALSRSYPPPPKPPPPLPKPPSEWPHCTCAAAAQAVAVGLCCIPLGCRHQPIAIAICVAAAFSPAPPPSSPPPPSPPPTPPSEPPPSQPPTAPPR